MLEESVKQAIRDAYFQLAEEKSLSPRPGQRKMIAEIANCLGRIGAGDGADDAEAQRPPHCIIEAGTGTGKTIAYAAAAIPAAQALHKSLVIATATIALQEQLVHKDLPDIRKCSGLNFEFALAKGRRRYLCRSRLEQALAAGAADAAPLFPDAIKSPLRTEALPAYRAMAAALDRGEWNGDRDEWRDAVDESIWYGVTTDHSQCAAQRCPNFSQCCFYQAREPLQEADVIVANHDLVLADLALGGGAVLPPPGDTIYIFDEAHHLPERALRHFAGYCRLNSALQWAQDCQEQLAKAAGQLRALEAGELISAAGSALQLYEETLLGVQDALPEMLLDAAGAAGLEAARARGHLRFPFGYIPRPLRQAALSAEKALRDLAPRLGEIGGRLQEALSLAAPGLEPALAENWHAAFGAMAGRVRDYLLLWSDYAGAPELEDADGWDDAAGEWGDGAAAPEDSPADAPMARWINVFDAGARGARPGQRGARASGSPASSPRESGLSAGQTAFELRCSPVLAANLLQQRLWGEAAAVIATSATMQALGSFDRFIRHAGAPADSMFVAVPSPFAFEQAALRVPAMQCDPRDPARHTAALIEQLPEWLDPAGGSLVLFASRRQMNEVFEGLPDEWRARILMQGESGKADILRRHRAAVDAGGGSVIFGLASFAEGVDLPGAYCEHVVIAKIPFAMPDSPVEAALGEWLEARGGSAFNDLSVPDASLKLVQACGRLLRSESDTGRVTIADRRLVTHGYGRKLLDALPPFRREIE